MDKVRLDKWLWAARFFKTRSLAKEAIDKNRVRVNEQRAKVSRDVRVGERVEVKKKGVVTTVEVLALSDQRGPAAEAQKLYRETPASVENRQRETDLRRAAGAGMKLEPGRPDKRDRRRRQSLKRHLTEGEP